MNHIMLTAKFIIAAVGVLCEIIALVKQPTPPSQLLTTIGAFFIGVAVLIP